MGNGAEHLVVSYGSWDKTKTKQKTNKYTNKNRIPVRNSDRATLLMCNEFETDKPSKIDS